MKTLLRKTRKLVVVSVILTAVVAFGMMVAADLLVQKAVN